MSDEKDEKKADWLDEAETLLIGVWDVLGRLGPKLVREVRILRLELSQARAALRKVVDCKPLSDNEAGWEGCARDRGDIARDYLESVDSKPKPQARCPRRTDSTLVLPGDENASDYFEGDDTCSYCGSLNPETFMARLEKGDVRLIPTDKNYKVYAYNDGGEQFKLWHSRTCPDVMKCDRRTCQHWSKGLRGDAKFYFQHLSAEQQHRLITLYNEKKLKLGEPGHFYVLPFFMVKVA